MNQPPQFLFAACINDPEMAHHAYIEYYWADNDEHAIEQAENAAHPMHNVVVREVVPNVIRYANGSTMLMVSNG